MGKGNQFRKIVRPVIIVVLAALMMISIYRLVSIAMNYREASDEYQKLEEYAVEKQEGMDQDVHRNEAGQKEASGEGIPTDYPAMNIHAQDLKAINKDYIAWLCIPVLEISYPVVKALDNERYLQYTFEGLRNSSGCIFIDCENRSDFSDMNTFIYGHNMKNGAMFGSLKRFKKEPELWATDPYFYLYLENSILKYEIFSYYTTEYDSDVYAWIDAQEEYDSYIAAVQMHSEYTPENNIDFSNYPPIVTLSTCSGSSGTRRLVVHGVLIAEYEASVSGK